MTKLDEAKATMARLDGLRVDGRAKATAKALELEALQASMGERLLRTSLDGGDVGAEQSAIAQEMGALRSQLDGLGAMADALELRIDAARQDLQAAQADAMEARAAKLEGEYTKRQTKLAGLLAAVDAFEGSARWRINEGKTAALGATIEGLKGAASAVRQGQDPVNPQTGQHWTREF